MGALQSQVSRLRHGLPDGMIEFHPAGYRMVIAPDNVDVHRFERLTREGARALADEHPHEAVSKLAEALSLWRGRVQLEDNDRH